MSSKHKKRSLDQHDALLSDDALPPPKHKKSKKAATEQLVDDEGNRYWELSTSKQPRRVTVSEFKGSSLISLREHYEKDGKILPGKKGISLTTDQYLALLKAIPQINEELRRKGVHIAGLAVDEAEVTASNTTTEPNEKPQKSNFEATSDEDSGEE